MRGWEVEGREKKTTTVSGWSRRLATRPSLAGGEGTALATTVGKRVPDWLDGLDFNGQATTRS